MQIWGDRSDIVFFGSADLYLSATSMPVFSYIIPTILFFVTFTSVISATSIPHLAADGSLSPERHEAHRLVTELSAEVSKSELLSHPFLRCYQEGKYRNMSEATRLFAINHYAYSRNFFKYLQAVRSKLDSEVHLLFWKVFFPLTFFVL